jgi:5,10-methylene-tetrahydrofolate dehydrogenase/methenyl tetrahydrofolate cyclohydrolase
MKLLDGKKTAEDIYIDLKKKIQLLKEFNIIPGLAVILVGNRTDSSTYVNMKHKKCLELGINSIIINKPDYVSEEELINTIQDLNDNCNEINGILLQLPLPSHINEKNVLNKISLNKDVDGFHFENIGKLTTNSNPLFVPCTPKGCIELLDKHNIEISGKNVCIIGRSNIVGLPLSLLLLHRNATITIVHSKTPNKKDITKNADILIVACGKAEMIKEDWIKKNCVIIDVGINRKDEPSLKKGYKLVGDVDFESVKDKVSYITPVPGGVGPMTIAMLMQQTVYSCFNNTNPLKFMDLNI